VETLSFSFSIRWLRKPILGKPQERPIRRRIIRTGGAKREKRSVTHKRLLYYVNVNRTSPDHLLLGRKADVDKHVE
jgi:hypothetical protein